jgi:flagellar assembly factor FliW
VALHFPFGLLGFPEATEYVLSDVEPGLPFKCLQAVHDPDLGFILMDPYMVMPDYQVNVELQDLHDLHARDQRHLCLLVILTIHPDALGQSTVNLQGPILINTENRWAKQLVLLQSPYHTRHPLLVPTDSVA